MNTNSMRESLSVKVIFNILFYFFACVTGEGVVTLTTAVARDGEISVKPTTLYKRIIVERNIEEIHTTPFDIFNKKLRRRNRGGGIWNWDYWCQQQPKTGNCTKNQQKFFYNAQLDECSGFLYSGCNGNKNRFNTIVECNRYCKGAVNMEIKDIEISSACSLQPNTGLCLALYYRYYYDLNEGSCKRFMYSGCGGNNNNFLTKHSCLRNCAQEGDSYEF